MAAAKLPSELYVLLLDGPMDRLPMGVFLTAKAALEWAALNPHGSDPTDGYRTTGFDTAWVSGPEWRGNEDSGALKPFGYRIVKFVGGEPSTHAAVKPYHEYELKGATQVVGIDVNQHLEWI